MVKSARKQSKNATSDGERKKGEHDEIHERKETLPAIFGAIVDYHNNLTQTRFTIAGLYIAATGFLASSLFSSTSSPKSHLLISFFGLFFYPSMFALGDLHSSSSK